MKKIGFTLIEILVSSACLVMFMTIGGFLTSSFYETYNNQATTKKIYTYFIKAKNKSITNSGNSTHGVYFDNLNKKVFIFKGQNFNNSVTEEIQNLDFEVNQNSDTEVTFQQLTGQIEVNKIFIFNNKGRSFTYSINTEGTLTW